MYTVKIMYSADRTEIIENVFDVTFIGEIMILCLVDLENRIVRPLKDIRAYTIVKFVPVTAELLGNAAPSSEVAPNEEVVPEPVVVEEVVPEPVVVEEVVPETPTEPEVVPETPTEPVTPTEPTPEPVNP